LISTIDSLLEKYEILKKKLVEQYGISKFPTLLVLHNGEQVKYDGPIKHEGIYKFLSQYAPEPQQQESSRPSGSSKKAQPTEVEYLPLHQATNQEQFDKVCGAGTTGTCFVSVLNPSDDAEAQKQYIEVLEGVYVKYKKFFKFVWLDGVKQASFVDALHLYSGFPCAAVLNPSKKVYSTFVGAFTVESLTDFLDRVLKQSRATWELDALPLIIDESTLPEEKVIPVEKEDL